MLADLSFAIDAQHDKRSSLQDWYPGLQLDHTTRHKSCHLLRLICMSFDEQSAPNETRSLCERKEKTKKYSQKKNSPRMLFMAEFVVCNRRAARLEQRVVNLASWLQYNHTTKPKSCHVLLLICMSFDEQSTPTKTRSLCARKEKTKKYSQKTIPRECCCWPNSSFAIDAQQD